MPNVSVLIPSYNHARYLPECLDSVLAQTHQDSEIVVVDDGSTDGSYELLIDYQRRYPDKIRCHWHPGHVNKGISATCNLAIDKSQGAYLAWLASDDVFYPDTLEQQVRFLEGNPEIGFVYGYVHFIDETGQKLPGVFGADISSERDPLAILIERNVIAAQTVMVRRECIEKVGPFDETLIYSDWEYWIRMLSQYKAGFLDRSLAMHRRHTHNTSFQPKEVELQRAIAVMTALRHKASAIGGAFYSLRSRALIDLQLTGLWFCTADLAAATQSLASAFEIDPSLRTDTKYLSEWLDSRGYYDHMIVRDRASERDFGFWTLRQLPGLIDRQCFRKLAGSRLAKSAFERYQGGDLKGTRRMAIRCLINDPRWLHNRGLISILIETLLGPRLMRQVRHFRRRLLSSATIFKRGVKSQRQ